MNNSTFQRKDAFVGYRDDTPAAVVFQANHLLHKLIQGKKKKSLEWIRFDDAAVFDAEILSGITSSHEKMHSEKWISAVRAHMLFSLVMKIVTTSHLSEATMIHACAPY